MDEPPSKSALAMLYVSDLTGAAIKNELGKTIGKVKDVVARVEDLPAPVVNGLVVRTSGSELQFVPWTDAAELAPGSVILNTEAVDNRPFVRRAGEMLLIKDLRDKEVVHVEGKRVVRVNDVALAREGRRWVVSGVDSSAAALVAQLGLGGLVRKRMKRDVLPWDEVEMFEGAVPVPLNLTHDKIGRLHPADIAKVFRDLGYRQSSE
ncbi:MAG: PRC-barrel domain-containing protein, partial [Armatimonadota bacterium]|nr:PRC-barrel domain-containing protein [Armatimonadota bacterium]